MDIDKKWLIEFLIYMVGGSIFYYFSSLIPIRVIIARSKKMEEAEKSDKPSLANFIFSDFFKNTTVTYNKYDSSGSFQGSETHELPGILDLAGLPIYILVYIIILFIKASFVPYWAIFSFFRNYVFVWLFPKKIREHKILVTIFDDYTNQLGNYVFHSELFFSSC